MIYTRIEDAYQFEGFEKLKEDCPEWLSSELKSRKVVKAKKHGKEALAFGIDSALQWVKPGGYIALRKDGAVTPLSEKSYKAYCKRKESSEGEE